MFFGHKDNANWAHIRLQVPKYYAGPPPYTSYIIYAREGVLQGQSYTATCNSLYFNGLNTYKKKDMNLKEDYSSLWTALSYTNACDKQIFDRCANTTTNSFEKHNFPIGLENCSGGNCSTQTLVDMVSRQNASL